MRDFSNLPESEEIYAFGGFRLDIGRRVLKHRDAIVSLTPKALETLIALIKRRGEIAGKAELLDEVWPGTFVEESTLSQNILTLRRTLSALDPDAGRIITVPRRGYRWDGEVRAASDVSPVAGEASPKTQAPGRPFLLFAAGVAAGLLVIGAAFLILMRPGSMASESFRTAESETVFSDSSIRQTIISPNGRYLVQAVEGGSHTSIRIRHVADANSLTIVPDIGGRLIGLAFSPDGDYVFFAVYPAGGRTGQLLKVPAIGGAARQIATDIDSAPAIAADGTRIAFVRRIPSERLTEIVTTDSEGKDPSRIATRPFGAGFQSVAFSPDGRKMACAVFSEAASTMELVVVDAETGESKPITTRRFAWLGQAVWLADSSGVVAIAYSGDSSDLTDEVWIVSLSDGAARRVSAGKSGEFGLSLSSDSRSIVTVRANKITSLLIGSPDDPKTFRSIATKTGDPSLFQLGADRMGDGGIVLATVNNSNADIWTIDVSGDERRQLTSEPGAEFAPGYDRTADEIVFVSNRTGLPEIWRMKRDGTSQRQVTRGQAVIALDVAAVGSTIYYTVVGSSIFDQQLWKVSGDGSDARPVFPRAVYFPKVAPDGKLVAGHTIDPADGKLKLALISTETREIVRFAESPPSSVPALIEWSGDGESLIAATHNEGSAEIWRIPNDGGEPSKLAEWRGETIFRMALADDGSLFIEKGIRTNDVVLIRDQD